MTMKEGQFPEMVRFAVVGGLVFVIDFSGVWFFQHLLPPLAAITVAYFIAIAFHFSLNKWWTFRCERRDFHVQLAQYLTMVALCWLCTLGTVVLALKWATSNLLVAKAVAVPPATILGFVIARTFVFAKHE